MSKWVKFSDRLPTKADADKEGEVFVEHSGGCRSKVSIHWASGNPCHWVDWFWLENVPEIPKPRTLEDVTRELLDSGMGGNSVHWLVLFEEMKEILGREEQ